jgi:hypothetical protein
MKKPHFATMLEGIATSYYAFFVLLLLILLGKGKGREKSFGGRSVGSVYPRKISQRLQSRESEQKRRN